jgi:hypothetical protein
MDRPVIRVMILRLNWETLEKDGPSAAMRGNHEFKDVDIFEVPYYLARGWIAICDDPEDRAAFAAWQRAHDDGA